MYTPKNSETQRNFESEHLIVGVNYDKNGYLLFSGLLRLGWLIAHRAEKLLPDDHEDRHVHYC